MKSKRAKGSAGSMPRSMSRRSRGAVRSGTVRDTDSDTHIDTAEIPPLTDAFFRRAVRNPFYRAMKQSTTVRIDADVLAWLKSQGPGYQTRINALLRAAMNKAVASKHHAD